MKRRSKFFSVRLTEQTDCSSSSELENAIVKMMSERMKSQDPLGVHSLNLANSQPRDHPARLRHSWECPCKHQTKLRQQYLSVVSMQGLARKKPRGYLPTLLGKITDSTAATHPFAGGNDS